MKKIFKLTLAMVLLGTLAACSTQKATSHAKSLETVGVAITGDANAKKLDATAYDSEMALYSAVYEPLVTYGEKGDYQPGLAKSWEISQDGKTYTFHLKKNAKFSDGSDFNASAVKFTIERAKKLNTTTTLQTLMNLESVEVVDDQTVTLHFNKISNQVLAELCETRPLRIMSPNAVEGKKVTGKFKKAIGTGPFSIAKVTDEEVTMKPNAYYNANHPLDYKLKFKTISDGSSRTLALRSGEIDIAGGTLGQISDSDIQSLKKSDGFKVREFTGTMSHFLAFNPDNTTLTSNVRKGIELAINKADLSEHKLAGLFQSSVQYVTKDNQTTVPHDVKAAEKIFEAAGYTKNAKGYYEKDGKTLQFNLVIQTAEFPEWKEQAEVIENNLKQAGVKININTLDSESYYDVLWTNKKFDMILYRTYTDALLPYNFLNSLFANTTESHGVLANDATLTQLLNDYANTATTTDQQTIFDQIFKRISSETLAIPIDYKDENFVTTSKVSHFEFSGLSDAPIDYESLVVK
ncbi:ABC transporter substrate-binding protein [Enterococcus hailinensis]|uniref:ABC transporter substrate-binding protein n=1 Tax=Enterococcus hailinensis TaxID=3238988 RepID=UPI0038B230F8